MNISHIGAISPLLEPLVRYSKMVKVIICIRYTEALLDALRLLVGDLECHTAQFVSLRLGGTHVPQTLEKNTSDEFSKCILDIDN